MKVTIATLFASIAAAQLHAPVGEPKGNAITRPLNEVVPACKQFTITWQPTTPNTVSVLLLKGPSTNVVKFGPALAEGIANSGSLAWTPASDLEATSGPTGYGIQIIDDVTGQYQYSTQFGISKGPECDSYVVSSSSSSAGYPVSSKPTPAPSSKGYETGNTTSVPKSTTIIYSTAPHNASTTVKASVTYSATSLKPTTSGSATTSEVPQQTVNAGSALQAGLGLAGAAAAAILML